MMLIVFGVQIHSASGHSWTPKGAPANQITWELTEDQIAEHRLLSGYVKLSFSDLRGILSIENPQKLAELLRQDASLADLFETVSPDVERPGGRKTVLIGTVQLDMNGSVRQILEHASPTEENIHLTLVRHGRLVLDPNMVVARYQEGEQIGERYHLVTLSEGICTPKPVRNLVDNRRPGCKYFLVIGDFPNLPNVLESGIYHLDATILLRPAELPEVDYGYTYRFPVQVAAREPQGGIVTYGLYRDEANPEVNKAFKELSWPGDNGLYFI
jgi:hypothetical protein